MSIKQGNIPEKLKFFIRPEESVRFRWDDVEGGERDYKVFPCYISDAGNKNTLETGKSWAEGAYWQKEKNEVDTLEIDNVPFKNLRILTLEIRDKGGRAYKVCADIGGKKNLYFDCREDVLLDSMFQTGVEKGGVLPGEFIFARVNSQMKPIRVGSFLHDKMIEATEFDKKGAIDNLEIGGVYENKRGDQAVYLGEYWTREPEFELKGGDYIGGWSRRQKLTNITFSKPFLVHVFHSYHDFYAEEGETWFYKKDRSNYGYDESGYKVGDPTAYDFTMVKKHSFKKKVKQFDDVPENYINVVKKKQLEVYSNAKYLQSYPRDYKGGLIEAKSKLLCLSKDKNYIHPELAAYIK